MNLLVKQLKLHLYDAGRILGGGYDRNYTRFVILGRSRVGSNMLRSILNHHNNVYAFNELFRDKNRIGWGMRAYRSNKYDLFKEQELIKDKPIRFLEEKIFKDYPDSVKAVGFKLFYYHAKGDKSEKIWDYLRQQHIRIIHLKRRNLLSVYLSWRLAQESGNWTNKQYQDIRIHIDPEDCRKVFQKTEAWWNTYDRFFDSKDMLEVWFEQLLENRQVEVERILDFLKVPIDQIPEPTTKKQSYRKPADRISNYDELKQFFSDSRWNVFFK